MKTPRPAESRAPKPETSPLLPESKIWSRPQALIGLTDERTRLSAAVRLVRLSDLTPLCVPDPLLPKLARRLRVVALSESRWALGFGTADPRRIMSPVLIDAEGAVTLPFRGAEEEVALLCVAEDADLFPHLLIVPERVLIVGDELLSALKAQSPPGLLFELRTEDGYPYLGLIWCCQPAADEEQPREPTEPVEVARYNYDPYELAFMGPLADKLPDPPGGLFELDLEQSKALIPVGGEIPEPPKYEPVQPAPGEPTPY